MKHQIPTEELSTVATDILKLLEKEPRLTPKMMEEQLTYGRASIKSSIVTLKQLNLVRRIAQGLYEITELGILVLHHKEED